MQLAKQSLKMSYNSLYIEFPQIRRLILSRPCILVGSKVWIIFIFFRIYHLTNGYRLEVERRREFILRSFVLQKKPVNNSYKMIFVK